MATVDEGAQLSIEAANALLREIARAAEDSSDRGGDFIEHLARSYALVRDALPKPRGRAVVA